MAAQIYRLTCTLRRDGLSADTRCETVSVIADSVEEAIELAKLYRGSLPSAAISGATLTDVIGAVIWPEQPVRPDAEPGRPDEPALPRPRLLPVRS
jgi:hypothetical protein